MYSNKVTICMIKSTNKDFDILTEIFQVCCLFGFKIPGALICFRNKELHPKYFLPIKIYKRDNTVSLHFEVR